METQGTFNTVRFYETLAMILSKKHGVDITVKVKEKPKKEETALCKLNELTYMQQMSAQNHV